MSNKLRRAAERKGSGMDATTVRERFYYDDINGGLRWRHPIRQAKIEAGQRAGGEWKNGNIIYRRITVKGRSYQEHVLVWLYVYGELPKNDIDHINQVGTDNRIENLRDVSRRDNCRNTGLRRNNKSGVSGVYWNKSLRRWEAQIRAEQGKLISLGGFDDLADAARVRREAERRYGYHPNHGQLRVCGKAETKGA